MNHDIAKRACAAYEAIDRIDRKLRHLEIAQASPKIRCDFSLSITYLPDANWVSLASQNDWSVEEKAQVKELLMEFQCKRLKVARAARVRALNQLGFDPENRS